MKRVALLLPQELRDEIQTLANVESEGGLNRQIRKLLIEALAVRNFPQRAMLGTSKAQIELGQSFSGAKYGISPYEQLR